MLALTSILFLLLSIIAYYFIIINPLQNEKALKQEEAKRQKRKYDTIFNESPTGHRQKGYNSLETLGKKIKDSHS